MNLRLRPGRLATMRRSRPRVNGRGWLGLPGRGRGVFGEHEESGDFEGWTRAAGLGTGDGGFRSEIPEVRYRG